MTHTFDSRGFFIFLVDLAQGVTLYESHGIYIHGKLLHTYICTLVFPHLSLRRLETNLIWVRVKWHYELYHRNHSTVQWSILIMDQLIIGIILTALSTSEWADGQSLGLVNQENNYQRLRALSLSKNIHISI